jgi:hypothetical protein
MLAAIAQLLSQLFSHDSQPFNEFLRAAELEEPVQKARGFQIKRASYRSVPPSNPTGSWAMLSRPSGPAFLELLSSIFGNNAAQRVNIAPF